MSLVSRIRAWRTRRFMATLPPVALKGDGGAWILDRFRQTFDREFNPFSWNDRETVRIGVGRAVHSAFCKVYL